MLQFSQEGGACVLGVGVSWLYGRERGCRFGELLHEPVGNIAAVRVNPSTGGYSLVAVLVGQIHRIDP